MNSHQKNSIRQSAWMRKSGPGGSTLRTRRLNGIAAAAMLALLMTLGCASTDVSRQETDEGKLPRPGQIWVYDFAATDGEIPEHSDSAGHQSEHGTPPTAEEVETARKLGALAAKELIAQIKEMGLPAERAQAATQPKLNDLVLHGYLLSIEEGDAKKRVVVGFGKGASELKIALEGFQMTAQGLRKLGSGTADAGGSKTPGGAVGLAALAVTHNPAGLIVGTGVKLYGEASGSSKIEGRVKQDAEKIAEVLEKRFQEQGWID